VPTTLTVDFLHIEVDPSHLGKIEAFLRDVRSDPSADPPSFAHGGTSYQLTPMSRHGDIVCGTLLRLRKNRHPNKVSRKSASALALPDGEDLGEPLFFAIDSKRLRAATAKVRDGAPRSMLGVMFKELGFPHPVQFTAILRGTARERLKQAKSIRRVELRVAAAPAMIRDLDAGPTTEAAASVAEEMEGASVRIEVSMGHEVGSLNIGKLWKTVCKLLDREEVKLLRAFVKSSDDAELDPIDLLDDRARTTIDVEEVTRSIDTEDCLSKMRVALASSP